MLGVGLEWVSVRVDVNVHIKWIYYLLTYTHTRSHLHPHTHTLLRIVKMFFNYIFRISHFVIFSIV
jgi:hypothetical protein